MTLAVTLRRARSIWVGPALGLVMVVALAGCGTPEPSSPTASPSATTGVPSPTEDLPTPSAKPTAAPQQLSGKVTAGVESGCLLLTDAGQDWLLVGEIKGLAVGQDVTVEGHPDPSMVSTCQQGQPFVVTRVL